MISELMGSKRRRLLAATVLCLVLLAGLVIFWQMGQVVEAAILDPRPGLVGWWRFDEGDGSVAEDGSGFGNDGVLMPNYPTNSPAWVDGKHGKALSFDGVDDYVQVAHDPSITFTTEDFTLMFWANLTHDNSDVILCKGQYKTDGWYLQQTYSRKIRFLTNQAGAYQITQTGYNVFSDDEWFHCAIVRNSSKVYIYIDAVDETVTQPTITDPVTNTRNLYIGRHETAGYESIGTIDEVRIYNRALSETEIQETFQKGPYFSSRLLAKVPRGTTQFIVTLSWQGYGSTNVTIESPSKTYTEDIVPVYQRTVYSSSGGDMLNIKRLAVSVTALSNDENWYIILRFDDVEDYRITVEAQR